MDISGQLTRAEYSIKTGIMNKLQFDNMIVEIIVSMLILTILSFITSIGHKIYNKYIQKFLSLDFHKYFGNPNTMVIVGKKIIGGRFMEIRVEYSDHFLGLVNKLSELNPKESNIHHIKEITLDSCYSYDMNTSNTGIYLVDQTRKFLINKDIYCYIDIIENEYGDKGNKEIKLTLTLCSNVLSPYEIRNYVNICSDEYIKKKQEDIINTHYYFSMDSYDEDSGKMRFNQYIFKSNITFDNIFFNEKELVYERLNFFMKNPEWYEKRGIPYKYGLMLYGDPGCGKTSLIKAIANFTKRHIVSINLNKIKTKRQLEMVFNSLGINDKKISNNNRIYVIEDIDCNGLEYLTERETSPDKEDKKDNKKKENTPENILANAIITSSKEFSKLKNDDINLSNLLEVLDGILEMYGRILIITTNYPEKLDKALVRPGRIDLKIEFNKCDTKNIKDIFSNFYSIESLEEYSKLNSIPNNVYTPAEIIKEMIESPFDPHMAVENLLKNA